jgi:hypothetical protein
MITGLVPHSASKNELAGLEVLERQPALQPGIYSL